MGSSSKVILVAATTLIVGTYAISLKQVQTKQVVAASAEVDRLQDEQTLDAAMRAALDEYVLGNGNSNKSGTLTAVDGGAFTYTVVKNGSAGATLTVTLTRGGRTRVATATLTKTTGNVKQGSRKIHRGKWEVGSAFVRPE
jgi:hypothetical protein